MPPWVVWVVNDQGSFWDPNGGAQGNIWRCSAHAKLYSLLAGTGLCSHPLSPPALPILMDSLRMLLVDGAIHTDRGPQPVHPLVLLDASQHGCQGGPAQVGRAGGDDLADAVGGQTVLMRWLQAQLGEDLMGFLQPFFLPARQRTKKDSCLEIQLLPSEVSRLAQWIAL